MGLLNSLLSLFRPLLNIGTGSRVPRPVRGDQRARRALVALPAGRAGRHVRLAAVAPARLFHQAETHLKMGKMEKRRRRRGGRRGRGGGSVDED